MATAKQYEILFQLRAQLDGALSSQFSAAQQQITALQGKVRAYQSTLNDISKYQKTQQSLESLTKKMNEEGQQTTKNKNLQKQYNETLEKLREKLKNAGVDTDNLEDEQKKLEAQVKESREEMQQLADLDTRLTNLASAAGSIKVALDGVAEAASKVTSFFMECVESAGTLEYTMSAVQAVAGATEEETTQLTALAKEMGATTVFTAQECAEALQTMGLAGWSTEEMMNGLSSVINMAAAAGEDLTSMTSIVSDALNAFGLSGEEAVTKYADVLAKASTSSNTTIALMGESLSYVESTASNLDYSIEDVSVALAVMANNALKGSVSGSALNTMLTRMSGANSNAADEMDALGLSMYNADGSAKDLLTFLEELRGAFADFGDDAQAAQISAYKLAGQRGMRGLLSIVNASEEEWEEMVEAIYDYEGAADSISDIRLDNYQGQVTLLESAWEGLKNTVGEAFLPVATQAAETLTDLCNTADEFAGENQTLVAALGGTAGGALVAATALGGVAIAVQAITAAFKASSVLTALGGWSVAIVGVTALVGGLATAVSTIYENSELNALADEMEELQASTQESKETFDEEWAAIQDTRDEANLLYDSIQRYMERVDTMNEQGRDTSDVQDQIAKKVSELNKLFPELALTYDETANSLSESNETILGSINSESVDYAKSYIESYTSQLETAQAELDAMNAEFAEQFGYSWEEAVARSNELAEDGLSLSPEAIGLAIQLSTTQGEMTDQQEVIDQLQSWINDLQDYVDENWAETKVSIGIEDMEEEDYTAIETALDSLKEAYEEAYDSAYESFHGQFALWDELEEKDDEDKLTKSQLKLNLEDQTAYWAEYNENLQKLQDTGLDMSAIWDDLTTGSEDAAEAVALMASMSYDELAQYLSDYDALLEEQGMSADLAAWYADETQTAFQTALDSMELDTEGLQGEALIVAQAWVDGLSAEGSPLASMGDVIMQAANESLSASEVRIDWSALLNPTDAEGNSALIAAGADIGSNVAQGLQNGMDAQSETIFSSGSGIGEQAVLGVANGAGTHSPSTITNETGQNVDQGLIDGMAAKEAAIIAKANSIGEGATSSFRSGMPYSTFYSYGQNAITGAINGINSKRSALVAAAKAVAEAANEAYAKAQDIHSPSKLWEYYSEMDIAGGVQGFEKNTPLLEQAAAETATSTAAAYAATAPQVSPLSLSDSAGSSGGGDTSVQVSFAPVITVTGNASAADIKTQLEACYPDLVNIINQAMDERESRAKRRVY